MRKLIYQICLNVIGMESATSLESKLDQSKKSTVICIPAYNEEKNIAKLIVNVKKYVYEIIVIDDGA